MTTEISVMYGSEKVKKKTFQLGPTLINPQSLVHYVVKMLLTYFGPWLTISIIAMLMKTLKIPRETIFNNHYPVKATWWAVHDYRWRN